MFGLCEQLKVQVIKPGVILTDSETNIKTFERPVSAKQKQLSFYILFIKKQMEDKVLKFKTETKDLWRVQFKERKSEIREIK